MNNLTNQKNQLTIEQWFSNKNKGNNINEKETQRFKSNVLAIKNNIGLKNANIATILEACYQATLFNLPLEQNFGYCWVVARKGKAQFQMGWKGYVQLALRSQQYKKVNVIEVKEGELKKIDYLKDEIKIKFIENPLQRLKAKTIGYCAYFKLKNGFEKTLYWTTEQVISHFNIYSEPYIKYGKFPHSPFEAMALKTVLTQLLRKWGIMTSDMQLAYESDQAVITENEKIYIDNPKSNNHTLLKSIDETINNNDDYININEHVKEQLSLIEKPFIKDEYKEINKIIDELEI